MYVTKLSLSNFKCFEKVDAPLSKITLLTGSNSSGKSSFLYGLLGSLQSNMFPFYLSPNGKYVNMGDYKEMVFKNLIGRRIGIDISVADKADKDKYNYITEWVSDKRTKMPSLTRLKVTSSFAKIGISTDKNSKKYIFNFKYDPKHLKGSSAEMLKAFRPLLAFLQKIVDEGRSKKKDKIPKLFPLKSQNIKNRRFKILDNIIKQLPYLPPFPYFIQSIERDMNFISSFRLQPERTYYQKSKASEKVGKYGENHIDQILEWENRKSSEFGELNSILRDLNLLYSIKSKQLLGGRFELRVKMQSKGVKALLTDVGFGISQFLPIIVADLQLGADSTLFLAQPEIHLHPSVQAALGDYLVKQVNKKAKRYLVETHSEYLLNRIRLAIVKGHLKPSDLSIYYFENSVAGTQTYEILFTKDGKIDNAPKSFFDTYMMDVMNIALNAK